MSERKTFVVPDRVIEQTLSSGDTIETPEATASEFTPSTQAARDLGRTAGDASLAAELLSVKTGKDALETLQEARRTAESVRANRNFSFTDGETRHVYDTLPADNQKSIRKIRERLIRKYADRGLREQNIGLLLINTLDNGMRGQRTLKFPGSSKSYHYSDYYLTYLGSPLTHTDSDQEQTIRFRGMQLQVLNLVDTKAFDWIRLAQSMGGTWFDWATTLPRLDEDQWAPTIKLTGPIR